MSIQQLIDEIIHSSNILIHCYFEAGSPKPQVDYLPSNRKSCSSSISIDSAALERTNMEEKKIFVLNIGRFFYNSFKVQYNNYFHSASFVVGIVSIIVMEVVHRLHSDLCMIYFI